MPPLQKRVRKRKQPRVRNPDRYKVTNKERNAAAHAERAVALPRHCSRLPPPIDPLQGIASTWDLGAVDSVKPLLDAFWQLVQAQPNSKWSRQPSTEKEFIGIRRWQLPLHGKVGRCGLKAAARELWAAVVASCPYPCPRCRLPLAQHALRESDCAVNEMGEGDSFLCHVDKENAVALIFMLPAGPYSGGKFRVALRPGVEGFSVRQDRRSKSLGKLSHRYSDTQYLPLPQYTACVVDGHRHGHEISRVTFGKRVSFVSGFSTCPTCE